MSQIAVTFLPSDRWPTSLFSASFLASCFTRRLSFTRTTSLPICPPPQKNLFYQKSHNLHNEPKSKDKKKKGLALFDCLFLTISKWSWLVVFHHCDFFFWVFFLYFSMIDVIKSEHQLLSWIERKQFKVLFQMTVTATRFQGKTWKEIENTCSSLIKTWPKYTPK